MVAVGFSRNILRARTGRDASRVSFIELFFDLVFVFAVTQVSHVLIEHPDVTALLHTVILTTAVWWVWINTTWSINWLNPEDGWVRGLIVAMMLLGLLMSTAIPDAFGDRAMLFAVPLIVLEAGRSLFTALAFARYRPDHALNFVRIALWQIAAGGLWIVGSFASPDARAWFWIAALVFYSSGPPARFWVPVVGRSGMDAWDISGEHMAERVGLFFILALGESILVTGGSFSEGDIDVPHTLAFLAAFTGAVLLWWLYFNHSARGGTEYISGSPEAGRVARLAYTYVPLIMVFGVVLAAVADEYILHDPSTPADAWTAGVATASFAIYFLGNMLFRRSVGGRWLFSHLLGALALGGVFLLHPLMSALALTWIVNAVTLAVVIADEMAWRRAGPSSDSKQSEAVALDEG